MSISIKFLGASQTVTGSCYMVHAREKLSLFLVDCGLFQGTKSVKALNYGDFVFDVKGIDFLLLTHAHTDHSGLLPKLYKAGFRGKIYATESTKKLSEVMLLDSAHIQELEVENANKRKKRTGVVPIEELYSVDDATNVLGLFEVIEVNKWYELQEGVNIRLWLAGHMLGATSIEMNITTDENTQETVLFSGDIGTNYNLFEASPLAPEKVDWLISESTYGDRARKDLNSDERREVLAGILSEAWESKKNIIIPAFAVERAQEVLYDIQVLIKQKKLSPKMVYVDSPLASKATKIFENFMSELHVEKIGKDTLFDYDLVTFCETVEQSMQLTKQSSDLVVLSASGMADAGRIRYYLLENLPDPEALVIFTGYQAQGTLGRLLQDGKKLVHISGNEVAVNAKLQFLDAYSSHADQTGLLAWIKARNPKNSVFLTHGEDSARTVLRNLLGKSGLDENKIYMPKLDENFILNKDGTCSSFFKNNRVLDTQDASFDESNEYVDVVTSLKNKLGTIQDKNSRRQLLKQIKDLI